MHPNEFWWYFEAKIAESNQAPADAVNYDDLEFMVWEYKNTYEAG